MESLEQGLALDVVLWFQSLGSPWLAAALVPFHYLGSESFFLLLVPLIYWSVDASLGRRLSVVFLLSSWSNALFKEWWQRPRPFQISGSVRALVEASGFGIPSGHAQNAVVLAGALAQAAGRPGVRVLVFAYALLAGLSRLVHGVHFPQDVVAGWLLGAAFLAALMGSGPGIVRWIERRSLPEQLGVSVAVTAASLALLLGLAPSGTPEGLRQGVASMAVFLGASMGFALETRWVGFEARGALRERLFRVLFGLAGLALLRFGLGLVLRDFLSALVSTGARYTLMGLWVGWAAPWVFVRTGLAASRPPAKPVAVSRAGR